MTDNFEMGKLNSELTVPCKVSDSDLKELKKEFKLNFKLQIIKRAVFLFFCTYKVLSYFKFDSHFRQH